MIYPSQKMFNRDFGAIGERERDTCSKHDKKEE
jgi:hypothetical protein